MAIPAKVDSEGPIPGRVQRMVSCQHGTRWVVDVATGRVLREPCATCIEAEQERAQEAPAPEQGPGR